MFFFNTLKALLIKVNSVSSFENHPAFRRHHCYMRGFYKNKKVSANKV